MNFQLDSNKPLTERELEVRRAEYEVASLESQQSASVSRMETAARELDRRLLQVKTAAQLIRVAGMHDPAFAELYRRLHISTMPSSTVEEPREQALTTRVEAINIRAKAGERIRKVVHGCLEDLSRLAEQLASDETAIQAYQGRLEREAAERPSLLDEQDIPTLVQMEPSGVPASLLGRFETRRQRVRVQTTVDFRVGFNTFKGFSTNLGEGGIFVVTVQAPPPGTAIDLQFTLPGGAKISTKAIVRWTRAVNDLTPDHFPGMGTQFTGLSAADAKVISQFVAAREPLFFSE